MKEGLKLILKGFCISYGVVLGGYCGMVVLIWMKRLINYLS